MSPAYPRMRSASPAVQRYSIRRLLPMVQVSQFSTALEEKGLELLHELVPNATVLALLVNPTFPGTNSIIDDMQVAARKRRVKLDV
jgi:hypothetical protein